MYVCMYRSRSEQLQATVALPLREDPEHYAYGLQESGQCRERNISCPCLESKPGTTASSPCPKQCSREVCDVFQSYCLQSLKQFLNSMRFHTATPRVCTQLAASANAANMLLMPMSRIEVRKRDKHVSSLQQCNLLAVSGTHFFCWGLFREACPLPPRETQPNAIKRQRH
jgi:hypothetical protein